MWGLKTTYTEEHTPTEGHYTCCNGCLWVGGQGEGVEIGNKRPRMGGKIVDM